MAVIIPNEMDLGSIYDFIGTEQKKTFWGKHASKKVDHFFDIIHRATGKFYGQVGVSQRGSLLRYGFTKDFSTFFRRQFGQELLDSLTVAKARISGAVILDDRKRSIILTEFIYNLMAHGFLLVQDTTIWDVSHNPPKQIRKTAQISKCLDAKPYNALISDPVILPSGTSQPTARSRTRIMKACMNSDNRVKEDFDLDEWKALTGHQTQGATHLTFFNKKVDEKVWRVPSLATDWAIGKTKEYKPTDHKQIIEEYNKLKARVKLIWRIDDIHEPISSCRLVD